MMLTCALQGLFLKDTFWRGILCCVPHAGRYSAAPTGSERERMLLSNHLSCCDECTTEQMWSI